MIGWWVAGPVPPAVRRAVERLAAAGDVARVAVMPDVHLAEEVCVGVALATRERVYPAAIGNDVGCGVDALPLGVDTSPLARGPGAARLAARLLAALDRAIPGERRGVLDAPALDWSDAALALSRDEKGWPDSVEKRIPAWRRLPFPGTQPRWSREARSAPVR